MALKAHSPGMWRPIFWRPATAGVCCRSRHLILCLRNIERNHRKTSRAALAADRQAIRKEATANGRIEVSGQCWPCLIGCVLGGVKVREAPEWNTRFNGSIRRDVPEILEAHAGRFGAVTEPAVERVGCCLWRGFVFGLQPFANFFMLDAKRFCSRLDDAVE